MILILIQATLVITGGILFGVYKEEIHHSISNSLGQDVLHGDSLYIADLDYASTLLLRPKIDLTEVKVWGVGAKHLSPAFDLGKIEIEMSWIKVYRMFWQAVEFGSERSFIRVRNDLVRVELSGLHLKDGRVTMHRTVDGHNHRLFRPPYERILMFASGERKVAGGFVIDRFQATNVELDYLKTVSSNPQEALPKVYKVQFDHLLMKLSSDSLKAYFRDFEMNGTIKSIRVSENEGLVNRNFKADGNAELIKLDLQQKLRNDTGFDLVSNDFNVAFQGLKATAKGILSTLNERLRLDVDFKSETGTGDRKNEALLSFLELTLSDRFLNIIKSYDPQGELQFDGKVYSKDNRYGGAIRIDLDYIAHNTSFEFKFFENGRKHLVDSLEMEGIFRVGGEVPSYISADIKKGQLYEGQPFAAEIILDNVFRREFMDSVQQATQPPLVSAKFQSLDIDFQKFLQFLEFQEFKDVKGGIDFEDFHFSGPIASLATSYSDLSYGGSFSFEDLAFTFDGDQLPISMQIEDANGGIAFNENEALPKFDFVVNDYQLAIQEGVIRDVIPYVLNQDRKKLVLENFLIEVPDISAREATELLGGMSEDSSKTGIVSGFSEAVAGIKRHVKVDNFILSLPNLDIDGLYNLEGVARAYPEGLGAVSTTVQLNIDQDLTMDLMAANGIDSIQANLKLSNNATGIQGILNLENDISNLTDFGCKLGVNIPIATHLSQEIALESESLIMFTATDDALNVDLENNEIFLKNEELEIAGGIEELTGSAQVLRSSSGVLVPMDLGFNLTLDDETIAVSISQTLDSLKLYTPGPQSLSFTTAQKYLSLVCEIDQNLDRIGNLDGRMTFETKIEEHVGEHGIDVLMNANRQGQLAIEDLSFEFAKGEQSIQFDNILGDLSYDEMGINVRQFSGNYLDSDFEIFNSSFENLLEFVLLGEPLRIDTIHVRSELIDLATIFSSEPDEVVYTCQAISEPVANNGVEPCKRCIDAGILPASEESEPIAFSIINFLRTSEVQYADAYFEKILFRPIRGSELFEIDNLSASGKLDSGLMVVHDLSANTASGQIFQYDPLEVFVKNEDTLTVAGAYYLHDIELHEVIEKLNNRAIDDLKSDKLNFRGKLFMDFDFVDTLTATTDINSLEFRINNMQILSGSAKALSTVGIDKKWKENVGGFQRFMAGLFLGNFSKKLRRPSVYTVNMDNMLLDKGAVTFDLFEFYNNQVNIIATGSYELQSGKRDVDLLLQRAERNFDFTEFTSTYCKNGFLTYFNITDDPEKTELRNPSGEETLAWQERFDKCLNACPCSTDDCSQVCKEAFPAPEAQLETANHIAFKLGDKKLKKQCD